MSAGIIESSRKPDGVTPWVQDHSLQLYGGDDDFGYRVGGSYQSTGEWTPSFRSKIWGLSGGLRARRDDFSLSLSAMHFHRDMTAIDGVDYPMIETLVAATIGYQATPNWNHTLTLGNDTNIFSYEGVSFGENTLQSTNYSRRTLRYFTSYDAKLSPDFSAIFTAGADATFYHSDMIEAYGFEYDANGNPDFSNAWDAHATQDDWSNYGYYGMAEFGYRDQLYLTLAGRVEEGLRWVVPSEQRQFQPRVGLSYVIDRGPATLKLRGQWGRSARAPIMDVRQASGYRANPHLGPDIKEGWDAGFDLTWRGIGKLSVTYFDEEGRNLLMPVTVRPVGERAYSQYQNVGIISNKGWEIEGDAAIGPVSLRGNITVPDNRWVKGSSPIDRRVGTRIASTPKYSGGGTISLRVLDGSVSANAYVLKMRDRDAVKRFNLRAEQPITDSLVVFGRIDNLLNDQDSERYDSDFYVTPGRTTVFGIRKTLGMGSSRPVFGRSSGGGRGIFGPMSTGSSSANAGGTDLLHPEDIWSSSDIVVTVPYLRNEIDVLSGTSVLAGTELTRQLRPSIGETLARQPGVSATSFGPSASRPVLRGFQGERIRVLTDGIGSIDVSNTSADHAAAINPLTADRIEVLRGPAALLFGSSAIGGVVNVIDSRIPRSLHEGTAHLDAITNYGSAADETSVGGVLNMPLTQHLVLHADGSYLKTGDMRTGGYLYTRDVRDEAARIAEAENDPGLLQKANARGKLTNSAARTADYAGGLTYIGDTGSLGFVVSHYDSLYGVPARFDPANQNEEVDDGHGHAGHSHAGIRLNLKQTRVDVRGEVETDGFFDRIKVRAAGADYSHDEIESSGEIGTTFFNKGYEGRIEAVQTERDGWKGAIGGQFLIRNFHVVGEEKFLPRNKTQQFGLFTLQSLDMGLLRAEAGARFEHSDLEADADADLGNPRINRSFNAFSFSLGGSLPIAEGVRVGLNASRTERAPSAEELFPNGPHMGTQAFEIGDPTFSKEASWGLEATLKGRSEGFSFAASVYHNWFSNYIYDYQTGGTQLGLPVYQYAQANARYFGIEGELSARLAMIGQTEIRADFMGDYVRATVADSGPAPRIPPLRLLGGIAAQAERLGGRIEVERAFRQDRVTAYETATPGYTMVNASLNWTPIPGNATSFSLSANNLFDVIARRHSSVLKDYAPLAGRDIRLTARFQL